MAVTTPLRAPLAAVNPALDRHPRLGRIGFAGNGPWTFPRSVLWLRVQRLDEARMRPLTCHVADEDGAALLGDWVDSL